MLPLLYIDNYNSNYKDVYDPIIALTSCLELRIFRMTRECSQLIFMTKIPSFNIL